MTTPQHQLDAFPLDHDKPSAGVAGVDDRRDVKAVRQRVVFCLRGERQVDGSCGRPFLSRQIGAVPRPARAEGAAERTAGQKVSG